MGRKAGDVHWTSNSSGQCTVQTTSQRDMPCLGPGTLVRVWYGQPESLNPLQLLEACRFCAALDAAPLQLGPDMNRACKGHTAMVVCMSDHLHGQCVAGLFLDLQLLLNLAQLLWDLQLVCKGCLPAASVHNLVHTCTGNGPSDTSLQVRASAP